LDVRSERPEKHPAKGVTSVASFLKYKYFYLWLFIAEVDYHGSKINRVAQEVVEQ
jgi:hypothetical protein